MGTAENTKMQRGAAAQLTSVNSPAAGSEIASYIAELSEELGQLASAKKLTFLASLLSLATLEAKRASGAKSALMQ